MKKGLIIIAVILLLVILELVGTVLINSSYVKDYDNEEYTEWKVKSLSFLNYYEGYIPYYNYGTYYYKTGDYDNALNSFLLALDYKVPEDRVCMVRINASLSILGDFDIEASNALEVLNDALYYLEHDDCLDGSPQEDEARQLIEDIKKLMEEMMSNGGGSSDQPEPDEPSDNPDTKTKEEELNSINQQSLQERTDTLQKNQYLDEPYVYYDGKTW